MLLWVFLGVYWVDRGGRTLQSPPVVFHTLVRLLGTEQRLAEPGLKPWSLRHSRDALKADLCSLSGCCNKAALFIPQVRVYRAALMHFTYFFYFFCFHFQMSASKPAAREKVRDTRLWDSISKRHLKRTLTFTGELDVTVSTLKEARSQLLWLLLLLLCNILLSTTTTSSSARCSHFEIERPRRRLASY